MKPKWEKHELEFAVRQSHSYTETLMNMKLRPAGNNYKTLKKYILFYKINISHFITEKRGGDMRKKSIQLNDILTNNVNYINSHRLKEKLYDANIKQRICEECGQDEIWKGKRISLILDHINGNHNDNSINNLRILCPNCNAATNTYCGKKNKITNHSNKRIKNKIAHDELQKKLIPLILNSNIDFTKFGWVNAVARLLNKKPQKVNSWMKKYMLEFYNTTCFKRCK